MSRVRQAVLSGRSCEREIHPEEFVPRKIAMIIEELYLQPV